MHTTSPPIGMTYAGIAIHIGGIGIVYGANDLIGITAGHLADILAFVVKVADVVQF